jgi:hypothetical protein
MDVKKPPVGGERLTMEWKAIETAPKDGTDVLLFFPDYKRKVWLGHYLVRESFSNGKLSYRNESWFISPTLLDSEKAPGPTHWMPIPLGPDANENISPSVIAYLAMQEAGMPAQPDPEAQGIGQPKL